MKKILLLLFGTDLLAHWQMHRPRPGETPRRLTTDGRPQRGVAWQPGGSLLLYDDADPSSSSWGQQRRAADGDCRLDYLDAGNGADTIVGGPGHDTIIARGGADVIYASDGQRDWIECGSEYDIAVVDRIDHVRHCEKVERAR